MVTCRLIGYLLLLGHCQYTLIDCSRDAVAVHLGDQQPLVKLDTVEVGSREKLGTRHDMSLDRHKHEVLAEIDLQRAYKGP